MTVRAGHGQAALDGIDLAVRGGEIVGIAGVSGNGQSALADLSRGLQQPSAGAVTFFGEDVSGLARRAQSSSAASRAFPKTAMRSG